MLKLYRVEVNEYGKRRHVFLGHKALFWYVLALWLLAGSIGVKVAGIWPGDQAASDALALGVMYVVAVPVFIALALLGDWAVKWWRGRRRVA